MTHVESLFILYVMNSVEIASVDEFKEKTSKIVFYDDKPIVIFKKGKKFFAIDNRCPHRGASLGDGKHEGDIVTCPWHEWKFSISTGQAIENPNCSVRTYNIFIEENVIKLINDRKR